jgi:hypothetical protein
MMENEIVEHERFVSSTTGTKTSRKRTITLQKISEGKSMQQTPENYRDR